MRFIDTSSLTFRTLSDREIHKLKKGYAILSHRWTWGEDEILYADIVPNGDKAKQRDGYSKFAGACALAKKLGYDLLWMDTCCINKIDSVELGEAINSMYRWYSDASICIAYLQDVTSPAQIKSSEWFNRGWTLQELIAPKTVHFYDRSWSYLGDKTSLSRTLIDKTGIPADVLKNSKRPQACSVAQRMSWAANRTTTRPEDRAYSLMGLFDVDMYMIYGERERAFTRLQERIISQSTDESIFVWSLDLLEDSTRDAKDVQCGLLATSPACFARCGNVVSTGRPRAYGINQFGLSISLPAAVHSLGVYRASLNATNSTTPGNCAILLTKLPGGNSFARVSSPSGESVLYETSPSSKTINFTVALEPMETALNLYPGFWLRKLGFYDDHIGTHTTLKRRTVAETDRLMLPEGELGTAGIIRLALKNGTESAGYGWIKLGFDADSHPLCLLTFPSLDDENPQTQSLLAQSEEFLTLEQGSSKKLQHPIFSDDWIHAFSRSMPNSYDSRMDGGDRDTGFNFTFQAPLFEISVSVKRVPDVKPTSTRKGEVWVVDIVAGKEPATVYHHNDDCCC